MRRFWDGTLRLGQVSIPVGIASAVQSEPALSLVRLHRGCGQPVSKLDWCSVHGHSLVETEIVRGYEISPGEYLEVSDDEIAAVMPDEARTIEITCTIARDKLDPLLTERSYLLAPSRTPVGQRPYELLRRVLERNPQMLLLCRLTVRRHQWVATVRAHPERRVLLLDKLHEGALVDVGEVERQLAGVALTDQELELGNEVVMVRTRARVPKGALRTDERERIQRMIESKLAGETIAKPAASPEAPPVLPAADLADALRSSLASPRAAARRSR